MCPGPWEKEWREQNCDCGDSQCETVVWLGDSRCPKYEG